MSQKKACVAVCLDVVRSANHMPFIISSSSHGIVVSFQNVAERHFFTPRDPQGVGSVPRWEGYLGKTRLIKDLSDLYHFGVHNGLHPRP